MRDRRALQWLVCTALAAGLAVPALGASPGPTTRESALLTAAQVLSCPSEDPGCPIEESGVEVRAVVTMIVDKDSAGWDDEAFVPNTTYTLPTGIAVPVPSDASKSTLTLMIEFTREGTTHLLTETYQDLGNWFDPIIAADCQPFCVPGWREPATEERVGGAATSGSGGNSGAGGGSGGGGGGGGGGGVSAASQSQIRIQFGWPGEALRKSLNVALGLPANALPYFSVTDPVEIFDHSAEEDTLATVQRLKVNIKALVAAP
jgi:uncharacterized membrane protein YgcG